MSRPSRALIAAALLAGVVSARAAEDALTAGRLLSDSVGARASGLAEAGTALVGDLNAISFNPAGLPLMKRRELMARYHPSTPLRRPLVGHESLFETHKARELLGWSAQHRLFPERTDRS